MKPFCRREVRDWASNVCCDRRWDMSTAGWKISAQHQLPCRNGLGAQGTPRRPASKWLARWESARIVRRGPPKILLTLGTRNYANHKNTSWYFWVSIQLLDISWNISHLTVSSSSGNILDLKSASKRLLKFTKKFCYSRWTGYYVSEILRVLDKLITSYYGPIQG